MYSRFLTGVLQVLTGVQQVLTDMQQVLTDVQQVLTGGGTTYDRCGCAAVTY